MDWAMDWSLPDDWHSRGSASWVNDIYAQHDLNKQINDFANPLSFLDGMFQPLSLDGTGLYESEYDVAGKISPAFRAAARAVNKVGNVGHHAISWYKHMVRWYKEFQTKWPVKCNMQSLKNFVDLPAAAHGKGRHRISYHKKVKAHFEEEMVKKLGNDSRRVSRADMQRAFDELLDELRMEIKQNHDAWFK